ncbi:histidine triad nucleotide-binding protein [Paramaledivibacter caminithermalis]|uniref:Histidine triad (HIT) family protein n=1 Tax=Paramaledivibacter caminithermalis (strain DSM 15212 / CIP 107654 / DViRD3) TaxID=1121301 RepID=A0A1M6M7N5_PARC5|nr:histidine triad nucleotide-binding protein [Paramaledivibacter caminithermalis]SHJ79253.1 histidine triad (HIT) family protein [Paramaledivibacter caminithermalis DSM 15212]
MDCIFCKIAQKEIPAEVIYEDDKLLAFKDISPAAPVHILFIPKEHIESANFLDDKHKDLIGHIFLKIKEIAEKLNIEDKGYRIVNNCGEFGGQTVNHLHFHLIAGRQMQWPPG